MEVISIAFTLVLFCAVISSFGVLGFFSFHCRRWVRLPAICVFFILGFLAFRTGSVSFVDTSDISYALGLTLLGLGLYAIGLVLSIATIWLETMLYRERRWNAYKP